jgi:hypothetical protein
MAVSVDTVYQRVLALANKEQRGYITPQEFNLLANQAQMTIFESYFYHKNARETADANKSNEVDESNISDLIDMKLRPFSRVLSTDQQATVYPTTVNVNSVAYPVFKTGKVFHGGRVAQKVSLNEFQDIIRSTRHALAITSPIYADSNIDGDDIIVLNAGATVTSSVDVECFRIPVPANWAYVVVNGKALYNSYAAVDFELHRSEEDTLVNKILELAGIVINKPGLTSTIAQLSQAENQLQNQ